MFRINILICIFFNILFGQLLATEESSKKKYNLSICAIFTNEARYLKEWIEFHQLVGVDHFYLYDIQSHDQYMSILKPFLQKGIVTLKKWPYVFCSKHENPGMWALGTQMPAYENAIKLLASLESNWLVFVDVDEFLIPAKSTKLTDIIETYKDYPGILLSEDYFDACEAWQLPRKRLLIETTQRVKAPKKNLLRSVEKMIFKPDQCMTFLWPPYRCLFKDAAEPIRLGRQDVRINHYINREKQFAHTDFWKETVRVNQQTYSELEMNELLEAGYQVEDPEKAASRFIPELLNKMR